MTLERMCEMKKREITGVYRRGTAWEAAFTDADGVRHFRRFASALDARRWREDAIEGRVSLQPVRVKRLAERFTPEAVAARLEDTPRALSASGRARVQQSARWIAAECADLLDVPESDERAVREALRRVQARRLAGGRKLNTFSPLVQLVGVWRESEGVIYCDGVPIEVRNNAPRLVRLREGVEVQPLAVPVRGRRTAEAALAALAEAGEPLAVSLLGTKAVATLIRRGLVEVLRDDAERRGAMDAIRLLMQRPQRQATLGVPCVKTLAARGWIRILDECEAVELESVSSWSFYALRRDLKILASDTPEIALPRRRQVSRLAAATNPSGVGVDEAALWRLAERFSEAADGDAIDRLLFLMSAYWLRQSEARGLQVRDVNLAEMSIRIDRQRTESGEVHPPKSRRSARRIPIIAEDLPRLTAWTEGRQPDEWIVPELLRNRVIAKRRAERTAEVGFRGRIMAPDLRHAGISLSRAAGSTADETARIAGHEARMSERIYDENLDRTAPIAALARARR